MVIENVIIILGPPGSGKGTQGKLLVPVLNYSYVSMGQVLRKYASEGTELGLRIKEVIDGGRIIPDEWIRVIFHEVMMSLPETQGVILDGFPRDLMQAPLLEEGVKDFGIQNIKVLFIEVPEEKLITRLTARQSTGEKRADDDPKIFRTRFEEYRTKTYPLKEYFKKRNELIEINGDQSVEDVHKEILSKLKIA
ncbi:MAG TPA: adenylate kinase [Verrucomicrobiae bacterium]|nr:adenylate kinase [Verrucomicrobiae bacterium]